MDDSNRRILQVWGPYLRRSTENVIRPGETANYFAEGTFFICHGKYEVLIKGPPGTKPYIDKRYFFFDSVATLNISQAADGSIFVNYDAYEE